jgi:hypothetical protein
MYCSALVQYPYHGVPCSLLAGIAVKLTAHREKEREQVEALLASQKHLTSNVRTLINSEHTRAAASGLHVKHDMALACRTLQHTTNAWNC